MNENKRITWAFFDPICIAKFVLYHIWMVILTALIFVMCAYLSLNLVLTPEYSSNVVFAVTSRNTSTAAYGSTAATYTVSQQFGGLLQSDLLLSAAAELMDLDTFPATIAVEVPEDTNIIQLTVTAASPELAYKSTLAIIECYDDYSGFILDTAMMDSVSGPNIPSSPSNATLRNRVLKLSAPIGALAMIALLIFLAMQRDTVQTTVGAKEQVDGELLATVFHERKNQTLRSFLKKQKKSLLISDPTSSFYYTETIHQLRVLLERAADKHGSQVFVITSCSENEGKSTVAANLALSLAQKHRRVLLMDADLRKPAQALIFEKEIDRSKGFGSLLTSHFSQELLDEAIVYDENTNLYTLYSTALHRRQTEALSVESFRPILNAVRKRFRFIIIDTPPLGFFADAEVVADAADASLLVVRQDLSPAIAINDSIDTLSGTRSRFLGYIFNNVRSFQAMSLPVARNYGYGYGYGQRYGYGYGYGYNKTKHAAKKEDDAHE